MKVMVFGADGMLGHQVARRLAMSNDVVGLVRQTPAEKVASALSGCSVVAGVDVRFQDWRAIVARHCPDLVVNCVGVIKQRAEASDPIESIEVNSLFPHRLQAECLAFGSRVIHISTDCVFSGERGMYRETDTPDPVDLYGRSKLLGELVGPSLTLRTSIIGLELTHRTGLVEWFLSQNGEVNGFTRAIWSGLTSLELSRVIGMIAEHQGSLEGVWHVSSEPISKFDLLSLLGRLARVPTRIYPDDREEVDRSLSSDRFRAATQYKPPSHATMLTELASEIRQRSERPIARR